MVVAQVKKESRQVVAVHLAAAVRAGMQVEWSLLNVPDDMLTEARRTMAFYLLEKASVLCLPLTQAPFSLLKERKLFALSRAIAEVAGHFNKYRPPLSVKREEEENEEEEEEEEEKVKEIKIVHRSIPLYPPLCSSSSSFTFSSSSPSSLLPFRSRRLDKSTSSTYSPLPLPLPIRKSTLYPENKFSRITTLDTVPRSKRQSIREARRAQLPSSSSTTSSLSTSSSPIPISYDSSHDDSFSLSTTCSSSSSSSSMSPFSSSSSSSSSTLHAPSLSSSRTSTLLFLQ